MKIRCPHCGKVAAVVTNVSAGQPEKAARRTPTQLGYTIPQAAKVLGVAEGRLRRTVHNGDIKTIRFGGLVRIPQTEVDRLRMELFHSCAALDEQVAQ